MRSTKCESKEEYDGNDDNNNNNNNRGVDEDIRVVSNFASFNSNNNNIDPQARFKDILADSNGEFQHAKTNAMRLHCATRVSRAVTPGDGSAIYVSRRNLIFTHYIVIMKVAVNAYEDYLEQYETKGNQAIDNRYVLMRITWWIIIDYLVIFLLYHKMR